MYRTVLQLACLFFCNTFVFSASETEANNPVFNLDHTALEKNIAAIFNKVAHSSATTKRSVPAFEAQVSQSTIHSTSPSPLATLLTTSSMFNSIVLTRSTNSPFLRELPSYAPPSRALFTPPLPPEYSNPFADKPTLRGTNTDIHSNLRRPVPPPSYTPVHERIPIKPPDLIESTTKNLEKTFLDKDTSHYSSREDSSEISNRNKNFNDTVDYVPSLHFTSISRILSGSNGRKQDIPDILLKPISTKPSQNSVTIYPVNEESTVTPILSVHSTQESTATPTYYSTDELLQIGKSNYNSTLNGRKILKKHNEPGRIRNVDIVDNEKLAYPQSPELPSKIPDVRTGEKSIIPHFNSHPLESTWKIAWSLHVYLAASIFTLIALYSVYKIVRFNNATNLLTQSYFLTIHLLLTIVCTLRCFYLFYDAYNLGHSLPETLSKIIKFLPSSLLAAAFATLILYMSRCSPAPCLHQSKFSSPFILALSFTIHITICIGLHVSGHVFGYADESRILPLICQCIYIILCVSLGLCYMYVYRVIRTQIQMANTKPVGNHIVTDFMTVTLNTAITTTIATALLFILMGFVQLYGVFGVQERLQPHFWLWWGWEFSVRLIELSMCGLLAWVASLSRYQIREKQVSQHIVHPGFALFPCGSSTSTENMDDALYPAICNTNHAIQNYTIRTGKHVYDDSFPLNTLPDHLNRNTFERHSTRMSGTLSHSSQERRTSCTQRKNDTQIIYNSDSRSKSNAGPTNFNEHSSNSGSTMLVAEDGFVRFRNLGTEDNDLSDSYNISDTNRERRNSVTCIDRINKNQSAITTHITEEYHQNSLPHLKSNLHRNHHLFYNT
ncbi:uncharacterized protein LOC131664467 [Phymastichus coffea]|uniref:uncharacterized protein LOC131664467 n=1 Tax=Phymastichus coffea TaxID=108790 RepID=UPI00273B30C6|nr:uncharacterized protein LOC131664467 [Phymastichus coffea]